MSNPAVSQITNPAYRRERGRRWLSVPGRREHWVLAPGRARRNFRVEFVFVPLNRQHGLCCAFEGENVVTGKKAWPLLIEVLLLGVVGEIREGV